MKKILIFIILIILVAGGFYIYYNFQKGELLSSDQQQIVDNFGAPQRFSISYLPQGEGDTEALVRTETWSYPDHLKEITFVGGKIFSVDDIDEETGKMTYSDLKPEDFDFSMNYDDIASIIGADTIVPIDMMPELNTVGQLQTYAADHVIFSIESDHLTYLETIGVEAKE